MFEQLTAREFAERLDDEAPSPTIIDTRPEDSYASWHVPGAVNLPFGPAETLDDEQAAQVAALSDGDGIVTICGKGATSTTLAAELDANGHDDVSVVKGGMRDWNALYEQARIETTGDAAIVQFQRRGKGCLSYLVGDPDAGEAVVVDPTRHTEQYVVAAAEHDVDIVGVLDTHVHADHVSGGRDLADRLDVPYYLGARAEERDLDVAFTAIADGDTLPVGRLEIEAHAAPGHTSELVAYRVDDALLTGDALFLDSVGRTELEFGEAAAERGACMAYETLHDVLLDRPDDTTILPGHVTVTDDGHFAHDEPGSPVAASLAAVRDHLDLASLDEDEFVERMVENLPEKPDNYETVIAVNSGAEQVDSSREGAKLETGANNCAA